MKIEWINSDRLRVFLSDTDLAERGIRFASMEAGTPQTDRLIRQVLRAVRQQTGHPVTGCAVEAFPVEGGCVLLLTLTKRQLRPYEPLVCRIGDVSTLFSLAARFVGAGPLPRSSLYEMPYGYILVIHACEEVAPVHRRLLAEYGAPLDGGEAAVAAAEEYGTLLVSADALEQLTAYVPRQPVPPDPPH